MTLHFRDCLRPLEWRDVNYLFTYAYNGQSDCQLFGVTVKLKLSLTTELRVVRSYGDLSPSVRLCC